MASREQIEEKVKEVLLSSRCLPVVERDRLRPIVDAAENRYYEMRGSGVPRRWFWQNQESMTRLTRRRSMAIGANDHGGAVCERQSFPFCVGDMQMPWRKLACNPRLLG